MTIETMLDQLGELYARRDLEMMEKQRLIDEVLTPEIRAKIADIETEFAGRNEAVNENIALLEAQIKDAVKNNGASVKGRFLHAVYVKGRVSWDPKQLEGLMMALPQLAQARKEGEPSVSIRKI